jgi:hypothetical protein
MQDRPSFEELLDAVREFLQNEIMLEQTDDRARFRTRVAINALHILKREWRNEGQHVRDELDGLRRLLHQNGVTPDGPDALRGLVSKLNTQLAASIRQGNAPPGTFDHLVRVTVQKLQVVNPSYLAHSIDSDAGGTLADIGASGAKES